MPMHHVQQGECLSSLAARYGFGDWRTIYEHAENAELRRKRPNPNLLRPGDRVAIPEKGDKSVECATGTEHRFKIKLAEVRLRIRLVDDQGHAFSNKKYKLTIDGRDVEGSTDDDGLVDEPIRPEARRGELVVWLDGDADAGEGHWLPLDIGALDPPDEITGAQARLDNLGYECDVTGVLDEETRAALTWFQDRRGLDVSGELDAETIESLRALHDE